jgi:hypothetical protein
LKQSRYPNTYTFTKAIGEKMLFKHHGTQFTCFTGTKVHILTLQASRARAGGDRRKDALYLLYWCKSTKPDAGCEQGACRWR